MVNQRSSPCRRSTGRLISAGPRPWCCSPSQVPVYQFGVNKLYKTPRVWRGLRARLAQQLAMPMVLWWGWWGTNQPLDDAQVYTVVGAPFPASQYKLEEIDKAHAGRYGES
jgi:hypothetical protein